MTDVAHQHQAAAAQGDRVPAGRAEHAVVLKAAGLGLAALLEAGGQVALHQSQPVAPDLDLLLGVNGRDAVLTVLDGGQGRFHDHIGDPGRIVPPDAVVAVYDNLKVQAVVDQHHAAGVRRLPAPADQLRRVCEPGLAASRGDHQPAIFDPVAGRCGVSAFGEGRDLVEQPAGIADDLGPARRIITLGRQRRRERIGAVQGVIEAAPAGIGGVEGVAGVGHRHHQLRPGQGGDLRIDVGSDDLESRRLGNQIADLRQELPFLRHVERLAALFAPALVDRLLQRVPPGQKGGVARAEARQDVSQTGPEIRRRHAGPGQQLGLHKGLQAGVERERAGGGHA